METFSQSELQQLISAQARDLKLGHHVDHEAGTVSLTSYEPFLSNEGLSALPHKHQREISCPYHGKTDMRRYNNTWGPRCAVCEKERKRRWARDNAEKLRERTRAWKEKNADRVREYKREYDKRRRRSDPEYRQRDILRKRKARRNAKARKRYAARVGGYTRGPYKKKRGRYTSSLVEKGE